MAGLGNAFSDLAKSRPEQFFPTNNLRQKRTYRCVQVYTNPHTGAAYAEPNGVTQAHEHLVLQQKFVSNHGREEWRDVEIVDLPHGGTAA